MKKSTGPLSFAVAKKSYYSKSTPKPQLSITKSELEEVEMEMCELSFAEKKFVEDIEVSKENLHKSEKNKSQISKEIERAFELRSKIEDFSLSEKYFTPNLLQLLSDSLIRGLEYSKVDYANLRTPWTSLRITENREEIMQIIKDNMQIKKMSSDNKDDFGFDLLYNEEEQLFQYKIKFNGNKCGFIFENIFPKKNSSAKNLFPEEIQLAMFEKLIEECPEVLDKLKNSSKISLTRSEIINKKSLLLISEYLKLKLLQERGDEAPFAEIPNGGRALLDSTPNQSNSVNFFNQLTAKYSLSHNDRTRPKVICNSIDSVSLKESIRRR